MNFVKKVVIIFLQKIFNGLFCARKLAEAVIVANNHTIFDHFEWQSKIPSPYKVKSKNPPMAKINPIQSSK